ncbi:MAG: undecaprenyl-phosphate glucose phosphotransferase, partial [Pseudolabrys sp.]
MLELDTRKLLSMATATDAIADPIVGGKKSRSLSPAALKVAAQPIAAAWSPIVVAGVVRMLEFVLTVAVGFAVYLAYVVPVDGFEWHYVAAIFGIATLALLAFQAADVYQVQAFRGYEKQYFRLASAWSVVFLLVIGATFFAKVGAEFSRVWLGTFYVVGLMALIGFRRGLFLLVRRWTGEGRLDRRTVIVGADERGGALINAISNQKDTDIRVVGVFDDRGDERTTPAVAGRPKLGTVDELVEFARRTRVDLVLVSLPISAESRILEMLKKLWVLPVDIRLAAHANKLRFRPRA